MSPRTIGLPGTTRGQATRTLREHQEHAYSSVRAEWDAGVLRTAVVHATGLGKGDLIGKMAGDEAAAGGRVLVLAHRDEILSQIGDRVRAYDPAARVGRVQNSRTERQHRITAASIQTVATRLRALETASERDRARILRKLPTDPTLILVDECHRAANDSYLAALRHYGGFDGVRCCGFTATMVRADKRGLGDVWESIADAKGIGWAVDNGLLVRPRGKVVVTDHMDLNAAKVSHGDYQDTDLGEMITQDAEQIVSAWRAHAGDRITIAFTPTVASAQVLAEEFGRAGVTCEYVTGTTPIAERTAMYRRLREGRTRVLVNVFVLVEGWDSPPVSCVLMARPTRLPGVYQQAVGRGLRQHPGKADCLVLDVVGASRTQRLVTLTDISPSSDYDTTAVEALPCEVCGLSVRQSFVGEETCSCESEPGERDAEGGRRRLQGPAQYEDLDLIMQQSGCVWLQTYGGTPILPAGKRTAIVWHDEETGLYFPGHMANRGRVDGKWLAEEPMALSEATALAESWALAHDPTVATRDASWRTARVSPSPAQLDMAAGRFRIVGAGQMTKGRLSDEISVALASERLRA